MYTTPTTDTSFDKYDEMRLHMEQLLSSLIIDIELPMWIAIPLDNAGIRRLRDLVCLTREDLLKLKQIGVRAVNVIEQTLKRFDLSLGMSIQ